MPTIVPSMPIARLVYRRRWTRRCGQLLCAFGLLTTALLLLQHQASPASAPHLRLAAYISGTCAFVLAIAAVALRKLESPKAVLVQDPPPGRSSVIHFKGET